MGCRKCAAYILDSASRSSCSAVSGLLCHRKVSGVMLTVANDRIGHTRDSVVRLPGGYGGVSRDMTMLMWSLTTHRALELFEPFLYADVRPC